MLFKFISKNILFIYLSLYFNIWKKYETIWLLRNQKYLEYNEKLHENLFLKRIIFKV
jgi:hypothetical protein